LRHTTKCAPSMERHLCNGATSASALPRGRLTLARPGEPWAMATWRDLLEGTGRMLSLGVVEERPGRAWTPGTRRCRSIASVWASNSSLERGTSRSWCGRARSSSEWHGPRTVASSSPTTSRQVTALASSATTCFLWAADRVDYPALTPTASRRLQLSRLRLSQERVLLRSWGHLLV